MLNSWTKNIIKSINDFKRQINGLEEYKNMTVAIDFDGTVVSNAFPKIGEENKPVVEVLKKWIHEYNVGIILDTMRSGEYLEAAVEWFKERGIELYGIGKHPTQETWTTTNKVYAQISIDDRNLGVPLIFGKNDKRARVDWKKVDKMLTPVLKRLND